MARRSAVVTEAPYSPRDTCRTVAPIMIGTRPAAASGTSHGLMPVTPGATNPIAAATSATPRNVAERPRQRRVHEHLDLRRREQEHQAMGEEGRRQQALQNPEEHVGHHDAEVTRRACRSHRSPPSLACAAGRDCSVC